MILHMKESQREDMVYTIAHRWELTFTVLVTFGGAFFASFPLFYSTSFGGAYWVWMLILFGFIVQAVSYKYRLAEGNVLGRKTYDIFLFLNGVLAPVLLGGAVSTFFFGSDFTIEKTNLVDASAPVISKWGALHGLEVLADWRVVVFGVMVLFLTRMQANLWFINQVSDKETIKWNKKQLLVNAPIFVVLFLVVVGVLLTASGYETTGLHEFKVVDHKYLNTFSLVASTVTSGVLLNLIMGDQFLSIIMNASIYREEYAERGYDPELLSRSTEDSSTVTSVLVPWTACGMTQSTVLGIPTIVYLPFCFFNIISPIMSCLVAAMGFVPTPKKKQE